VKEKRAILFRSQKGFVEDCMKRNNAEEKRWRIIRDGVGNGVNARRFGRLKKVVLK
jgi:hypothetical protein